MISLKKGALILNLKPELLLGIMIIKSVFEKYNVDLVLTEVTGAKHSFNSLHYKGLAADIRSKTIKREIKHTILFACLDALGENFDMILENENEDNEHFHLEFDTK